MKDKRILLSHGAGGKLSHDLVQELFLPFFDNDLLRVLEDSAVIPIEPSRVAFTTDSYVVKPLFFPGGNIGRLAICGTVNDLGMAGARPLGLSASFILEEGLPIEDLERILVSMKGAAQEAGVKVVAGDTKVVEHGAAEGIFITTAGIGIVPEGVALGSAQAKPGDAVIVSGPLGDHEIAVLMARGEFALQGEVESDCAPLIGQVIGIKPQQVADCLDLFSERDFPFVYDHPDLRGCGDLPQDRGQPPPGGVSQAMDLRTNL